MKIIEILKETNKVEIPKLEFLVPKFILSFFFSNFPFLSNCQRIFLSSMASVASSFAPTSENDTPST